MINSTILAKIIVLPKPADVILPNNYTYSVFVREFPNIVDVVNKPTFDNELINFSNTSSTMDQTD